MCQECSNGFISILRQIRGGNIWHFSGIKHVIEDATSLEEAEQLEILSFTLLTNGLATFCWKVVMSAQVMLIPVAFYKFSQSSNSSSTQFAAGEICILKCEEWNRLSYCRYEEQVKMLSLEHPPEFAYMWENVVKHIIAVAVDCLLRALLSPSASGSCVLSRMLARATTCTIAA